ncbi:unnamed protein product [Didymodactylos carnosus]|uniref:Uncharacterized protein n=1 Tax=Didymodactylos carnosus TaxID=1234261 RepID=A0A8S2HSU8_9BILA|nr:unnamed protein product [Didymodactylos carnosus]CAF3678103.1 unnamed protein product [Didymodactylos carnosus]
MRFLDSIEALVNTNNFYEAEKRMEYIIQIRHLLGTYCTTEEVTKRVEQLQNSLNKIVDEVVERYKQMSIHDFRFNPPKEILDKLQQVACHNPRYNESWNKVRNECTEKFREFLKDATEAKPIRQNDVIRQYEAALWSLPEDLKKVLESDSDNFKRDVEK